MRHGKAIVVVIAALVTLLCVAAPAFAADLTPEEQLGKALFFDTSLSDPVGQSCATCHAPEVGWTGPDERINGAGAVYPGAVSDRFGNRKPPAAAYGGDSPFLHYDTAEGLWIGGMFWDGRATGWRLGDPLAEQALGPFLNPLEQNMARPAAVITGVHASTYAALFEEVADGRRLLGLDNRRRVRWSAAPSPPTSALRSQRFQLEIRRLAGRRRS